MKTNLKGQKILIMLLLFYYRWQHKKPKKLSQKLLQKEKNYSKIIFIINKEGEKNEICTHSRYAF